ncbi:unnamed protein product [Tilletia laevis]|uniref:Uncharacterized protein n=1 Tax=Tilletia laevis TaxID=157183 RepID=A0A9N8LP87_9BASI|nr:unnamed protein product [Tilletia laevis]
MAARHQPPEATKIKFHKESIYYLPWNKVGARVAGPNFHEVLAQWKCVIVAPNITTLSTSDDVWECLHASLRPYQDDLTQFGFRWCATNGSGTGHRLSYLSLDEQGIDAAAGASSDAFYPDGKALQSIYARKQAYIVSMRQDPPHSIFPPLPAGAPPLQAAFDTVKVSQVSHGPSSGRATTTPRASSGTSQCGTCAAVMPPQFLAGHECRLARVKMENVKVEKGKSSNTMDDARKASSAKESTSRLRRALPAAVAAGDVENDGDGEKEMEKDETKQVCPVCGKKETPEPWSEDENQYTSKGKAVYHSDCLSVTPKDGMRQEMPRKEKAWRCGVCKEAGLIAKNK